ncbi:hypothetical protein AMECASPLE_039041 [Ameca splendens]|uniref:Brix domain-containing protein n=1 Tax=Ameca splendens TaxID=208324 RepID=A0ABV0YW24_9TELE
MYFCGCHRQTKPKMRALLVDVIRCMQGPLLGKPQRLVITPKDGTLSEDLCHIFLFFGHETLILRRNNPIFYLSLLPFNFESHQLRQGKFINIAHFSSKTIESAVHEKKKKVHYSGIKVIK